MILQFSAKKTIIVIRRKHYSSLNQSANDYYPFGMQMPGRHTTYRSSYRHGLLFATMSLRLGLCQGRTLWYLKRNVPGRHTKLFRRHCEKGEAGSSQYGFVFRMRMKRGDSSFHRCIKNGPPEAHRVCHTVGVCKSSTLEGLCSKSMIVECSSKRVLE